jgi:hypothetical protein
MGDSDWSREEVEAIVSDHFHMLTLELSGQAYNKQVGTQTRPSGAASPTL